MQNGKTINIEKLQSNFTGTGEVKDFKFTKVFENEFIYTYRVNCDSPHICYYEIFEKKIVAKCIDFNKKIYSNTEFKEIYPKSEDFGKWAWTVKEFEDSEKKRIEIEKRIKERKHE